MIKKTGKVEFDFTEAAFVLYTQVITNMIKYKQFIIANHVQAIYTFH